MSKRKEHNKTANMKIILQNYTSKQKFQVQNAAAWREEKKRKRVCVCVRENASALRREQQTNETCDANGSNGRQPKIVIQSAGKAN